MKTIKKKKLESKGWKVGTTSEFLGFSKKELNKIEQHPINLWIQNECRGERFMILCDDTDDRGKNKNDYAQWHSLLVQDSQIIPLSNKWKKIKNSYGIQYLSCKDHSHILKQSNLPDEIHSLFRQLKISHVFSSCSDTSLRKFSEAHKKEEKYQAIKPHWNLNDPKDQMLLFYLKWLDEYLKREIKPQEAHVFCDRTSRSGTKFKTVPTGGAWGYREHYALEVMNSKISFKTNATPQDDAGTCLDLADFAAWSINFMLKKLEARDFAKEKVLNEAEYESRLSKLPIGEQKIIRLVCEDIGSKRIAMI